MAGTGAHSLPGTSAPAGAPHTPAKHTAARVVVLAPAGAVSQLWERLRAARRFANLRQIDVAKRVGKSRATIALWESRQDDIRTHPSAEDVRKFCEICKVPVAFVMDNRSHPDDVYKVARGGASSASEAPVSAPASAAMPRNALLGMEDRDAQMFWNAVEFDMVSRAPAQREHFANGAGPNFIHDGNAVVFASDSADGQAVLVGAMSVLLEYQRAEAKTLAKHVLVYARNGGTQINEREAASLLGVSVHQVDNIKQATKYLQGL